MMGICEPDGKGAESLMNDETFCWAFDENTCIVETGLGQAPTGEMS